MIADLLCEFCGEREGLDRCDWPMMNFVAMRVRDLQVGDVVRRFNDARVRRAVATVAELQDFQNYKRRVVLRIEGKKQRYKVFTEAMVAAIRIKRDSRCGRVCCANCRVDRGPGGVNCAEHWRAWEQVA